MTDDGKVTALLVPNHHGHHKGFTGIRGWLAAISMRRGRTSDAELAMRLTDLASGERLVDVGCGPGVAARLAAERRATVTGIDPAEVMLRFARNADRAGAVEWRAGAAEALPLPDSSCDIAWSLSTVHHWLDLEGGLAELGRVLAPGGRFLATERRVKPGARGLAGHGWTDRQAQIFADRCASAGFSNVESTSHQTNRRVLLAVLAHVPV